MNELNTERCDLCDVKFTSMDHANSHYAGKKHKKKACDIYAHAASMAKNGNHRQLQKLL